MAKLLTLNNIHPTKAAKAKRRIRVGRGNSSGIGAYSGRGKKGQNSRTGTGGLKIFALRQQILRTPKLRGFKSLTPKPFVFNVSDIASLFNGVETINMEVLKKLGLIKHNIKAFKVLGQGEITAKVVIDGGMVSKIAKEKIEKAGGTVIAPTEKPKVEKKVR